MMPGKEHSFVPFNDHIFFSSGLRGTLRDLLPDDAQFEAAFDRFEYLAGLVHADQNQKLHGSWWAPVGCFVWRRGARFDVTLIEIVQKVASEVEAVGTAWPPLAAGLFDGSLDRLVEVMTNYNRSIVQRRQ